MPCREPFQAAAVGVLGNALHQKHGFAALASQMLCDHGVGGYCLNSAGAAVGLVSETAHPVVQGAAVEFFGRQGGEKVSGYPRGHVHDRLVVDAADPLESPGVSGA